ncbi:response regulator transcription factor [Pleionea mediterranea]|jgi:DNA-binding NarL/FixJ family response regulator|uniref:LuxR family two component transcriptional regulator n=1 Tax=Pleionea mediterranea TaxID=523701 RepID=A0A316FWW6_9GAMM|nr:response regulator transcription factor [Pleionea mediterranea]PWK53304.1 LuxR family two component transcriptional regulator [Pleionea mediterranea]
MSDLKILVADDHPLFRSALIQALNQCHEQCEIVQAESYTEALEALASPDFDLALIDLNMPGDQGQLHLSEICRNHPDVAVTVVSGHDDRQTMARVKAMGAAGFITKSSSLEQLVSALNQVIEQGEYWSLDFDETNVSLDQDTCLTISQMTPQQKRVLAMIADGKLNKQIAYELSIQETTIKQHVSAILKKLGVYNRTQAGLIYQRAINTDSELLTA